jgi:HSP20 family protein
MAQNDPRGMEAAPPSGTTGSRTGTESSGASAGSRSPPSQGTEESRTQTTVPVTTTPGAATSGREEQQQPRQSGGRLTRRESLDDPLASFFGGSPFSLFRRLSDDMDRLFFGGSQGVSNFGPFGGGRFMPHIDVEERDDRIIVRADLPGCRSEDFRVEIEDDALVIQGERRSHQEETKGGIRRAERSYGSFRRVIALPPGADIEAADARFDNGELEIEIPVQQQTKSRRLEVHSRGGTGPSSGTSGGTGTSETTRH